MNAETRERKTRQAIRKRSTNNPICSWVSPEGEGCDYRKPHPPHDEKDTFHPPLPEVFEFDENGNVIGTQSKVQ